MATIVVMEVTTTVGCPIDCKYCPQSNLLEAYKSPVRVLTLEDFKRYLDKLPRGISISFAGFAEPFLNPQCAEMILYAHINGFQVSLYTTLMGMSTRDWETIRNIEFRHFDLHFPDTLNASKIPVSDPYLKLLERVIIERRRWCSTDFGAAHGPLHPKVKALLGKYPAWHHVGISPPSLPVHDRAGLVMDPPEMPHRYFPGKVRCMNNEMLDRNVLLPDGSVTLCCMDFGLAHVLGNLNAQSYREIMDGEPLRQVKALMNTAGESLICRHCSFAEHV